MAESGVYEKLVLPRASAAPSLPTIATLNLTEEKPERGRWLAPRLVAGLRDRLDRASSRCCSSTAAAMRR
jgi:primosomal protein N' (replication factor Y)